MLAYQFVVGCCFVSKSKIVVSEKDKLQCKLLKFVSLGLLVLKRFNMQYFHMPISLHNDCIQVVLDSKQHELSSV